MTNIWQASPCARHLGLVDDQSIVYTLYGLCCTRSVGLVGYNRKAVLVGVIWVSLRPLRCVPLHSSELIQKREFSPAYNERQEILEPSFPPLHFTDRL